MTATFITTLILFSCTKDDDNQIEIAKIKAVKAGVLHNKYLDETLNKINNLSSKSANNQDELKNIILDEISFAVLSPIFFIISDK